MTTTPSVGTGTLPRLVSTSITLPATTLSCLTWQFGTIMRRFFASSLFDSNQAARAAFINNGRLLNLLKGKKPDRSGRLWTANGASSFIVSCWRVDVPDGKL